MMSFKIKEIIDNTWSLFLDRDGVVNVRPDGDYVKKPEEFHFINGVPEAINRLNTLFIRTILVTNQQGIGKGVMTEDALEMIHKKMNEDLSKSNAKIDAAFFCPDIAGSGSLYRKPNIGMALLAKKKFPEINFKKSIMVGDAYTDMQFGKKLGMKTIFISNNMKLLREYHKIIDLNFASLPQFADFICQK